MLLLKGKGAQKPSPLFQGVLTIKNQEAMRSELFDECLIGRTLSYRLDEVDKRCVRTKVRVYKMRISSAYNIHSGNMVSISGFTNKGQLIGTILSRKALDKLVETGVYTDADDKHCPLPSFCHYKYRLTWED